MLTPNIPPAVIKHYAIKISVPVAILKALREKDKKAIITPAAISTIAIAY
jgi:hypothetical protein